MNRLFLAVAAGVLVAGGCSPGSGVESSAPAEQAVRSDNASSETPSDAAPAQVAEPGTDASAEAALKDCEQRQTGPAPANEKPPVNAKGLYANKGECRGCSTGWWHTAEPATLYSAPDLEATQVMSVPAGTWLYAVETISFTTPTRGVIVTPGGKFAQCDAVYHVYTSFEEGESWDTVWRQGELLVYDEGGDAVIHWIGGLPFVDLYKDDGWWVRLRGRNGEAGWAWATAREYEFACKWPQDPEDICTTAPKQPPPGQAPDR